MAKDVVTFLNWASEPEHDDRKKMGLKAVILFSALTAISLYVKRFKWSYIKSRKICTYLYLLVSLLLTNPLQSITHLRVKVTRYKVAAVLGVDTVSSIDIVPFFWPKSKLHLLLWSPARIHEKQAVPYLPSH